VAIEAGARSFVPTRGTSGGIPAEVVIDPIMVAAPVLAEGDRSAALGRRDKHSRVRPNHGRIASRPTRI
jgi:hypothetical protein